MNDTIAFVCFPQDMSTVMSSAMDTAIRYEGGSQMIDIGKDLQEAFMDGYNYRDAEIVRCKDCRNAQYDSIFDWYYCNGNQHDKDFFCKNGDRRTEE